MTKRPQGTVLERKLKTMTVSEFLAVLRSQLLGSALNPLARLAWCRKQRRDLGVPGHPAVWVRGEALPWAEWGERHGYFEVLRMDGLPYLSPVGAMGG
jgi:hypothetical protein